MAAPNQTRYQAQNGQSLPEFIQRLSRIDINGMFEEYKQICDADQTFPAQQHNDNGNKNRYANVICFDHSRVALAPEGGYINANYVDGLQWPREFIATQGPKENTFVAFWRMVWQEGVSVIAVLTKMVEAGVSKCEQYWPSYEGKATRYGTITVQTRRITPTDAYELSELKIQREAKRNAHGEPAAVCEVARFRLSAKLRRIFEFPKSHHREAGRAQPPNHCALQRGYWQISTFIALDICIRQFDKRRVIDVRRVVQELRKQRYHAVQRREQYAFLNLALIEYALTQEDVPIEIIAMLGRFKEMNKNLAR